MKSYATKAVAVMQAGNKTKKTGEQHLYLQDGDLWLVGTHDEITAEIIRRETLAEEAAKAQIEPKTLQGCAKIVGKFHRQTKEMVAIFMGNQDRKPSWFKREDIVELVADDNGEELALFVQDGFKHCGKIYKAAA